MNIEAAGKTPMSQVSVTIGRRKFRIACEDGQESHLTELAAGLDKRIGKLREIHGEIGERLTIMAALSLADEFAEASARAERAEAELAELKATRQTAAETAKATQTAVATALSSAAERIESMARRLNQTRNDNGGNIAMG
jgi:cell division protein ZapA